MRIMGLDIGTKNIGLAVSDEMMLIAQGRGRVQRTSDHKAVREIKAIVEDEDVKKIIVGLPINMDGSEGERARDSRKFAERIRKEAGVMVELWDERLSTKEAEDIMIAADVSRAKRKKVIDTLAAQIILQGYLDSRERE
jgi:putative pre-16S rRNA nuclease